MMARTVEKTNRQGRKSRMKIEKKRKRLTKSSIGNTLFLKAHKLKVATGADVSVTIKAACGAVNIYSTGQGSIPEPSIEKLSVDTFTQQPSTSGQASSSFSRNLRSSDATNNLSTEEQKTKVKDTKTSDSFIRGKPSSDGEENCL